MNRLLLITVAMLVGTSAFAESFRIKLRQDYSPGQKIFLKQELNRQLRWQGSHKKARDYKLLSVKVVAEGRGPLALMMNHQQVDRVGLIRDGYEKRPGVFAVNLQARRAPHFQNGPWQIQFKGGHRAHFFVKRIVIEAVPKYHRSHRQHHKKRGKRLMRKIFKKIFD